MAEAILYDIAGSLLKNLGSRALDEIASAWGFKTRLGKLKNTINTIKDVLLDAEERQFESHAVRGWLDRLKAPLYAADDLFDEFATVASQREVMGKADKIFSGPNHIAFAFSVSRKIKKIREVLDDIVKDSSEFAFVLRPTEEGRLHKGGRDQSYSFVDVNDVIGREDDKEAIIDTLMASSAAQDQPLSVISVIPIVGIGGMGKTTLAQLLYNDERVQNNFELRLWVCVSEVFDIKEVVKKILMSATNKESPNLEMDQLQGQLREQIGRKKYLLVLDDVWNEEPEKWRSLSAILNVGEEGSKIIVTTRSKKVAEVMGTIPAFLLAGLSKEKSWALFEKMAFEAGESQKKPHLVKLGEEIVQKCGGVPLALRALGTLLLGNEEPKWKRIADTSFAELHDTQINIMAIVKLSYTHLLSPLKKCFAYCALFPKDYVFRKEILVDLWMAEGFVVPPNRNHCLKALGDEYLIILLQRCFFQDVTRDEFGEISSFKMHDLMHDLALDVSGTDCKVAMIQDTDITDRIRHLSLDHQLTNSWKIPSSMLTAKQLRTFVLPQQFQDGSDFNSPILQQLISCFKCLRVLDLGNLGFKTLPKSIGKLIHLRYLNLSNNPIEELPNSITKLVNMQTLILKGCRHLLTLPLHTRKLRNMQTLILNSCSLLRRLPIDTRKLTNLRTLDIRGCVSLTHMPPGLGELTSLHKLPYFVVGIKASAQLRDLKTLNNLRGSLEIVFKGGYIDDAVDLASDTKEADLNAKYGLTELTIYMRMCPQVVLEALKPPQNLKKFEITAYSGHELPSWAMGDSLCMTLPNLVEIRLVEFNACRQVPCFSHLPFLKRLTLRFLTKVEYMEKSVDEVESPSTRTFFPSLQELVLESMYNLKGWWEETNVELSFSGLIKLHISGCPHLVAFPLSPNVEELNLKRVNKELTIVKKVTSFGVKGDVGSSEYTSKLKRLYIEEIEILGSLPVECLARLTSLEIQDSELKNTSQLEEVFKHLSSLTSLKFSKCTNLTSISVGMEHLVSLETLILNLCRELDISVKGGIEDGMPWKALTTLRTLELQNLRKLKHLPSGIQHLTNLRYLLLSYNDYLEEVPEWIDCFLSLQSMKLVWCNSLRCLPEEVRKLTSLNELIILSCSGLTKRCRGPNGADWPYIRHIPFLQVHEDFLIPVEDL